jgi:hypothetical protein
MMKSENQNKEHTDKFEFRRKGKKLKKDVRKKYNKLTEWEEGGDNEGWVSGYPRGHIDR